MRILHPKCSIWNQQQEPPTSQTHWSGWGEQKQGQEADRLLGVESCKLKWQVLVRLRVSILCLQTRAGHSSPNIGFFVSMHYHHLVPMQRTSGELELRDLVNIWWLPVTDKYRVREISPFPSKHTSTHNMTVSKPWLLVNMCQHHQRIPCWGDCHATWVTGTWNPKSSI